MSSSSSTPTPEDKAGPSTKDAGAPPPAMRVGHVVLVRIDDLIWRPLIIAVVHPDGSVSGPIACEAGDHTRPGFRGWESGDGARISGHPTRVSPFGYGELLKFGDRLGYWIPRAKGGL